MQVDLGPPDASVSEPERDDGGVDAGVQERCTSKFYELRNNLTSRLDRRFRTRLEQ